ncbi:hypothetical protein [Gordonia tangerina]|uniref:Uncharacterized protein n=1 Tax=Gordonia tangerina TaxID=2911060 RepID=A0ABS9DL18_9ACTN|nr:hypothetical protein [Gordonia tangerina]MCF3939935.1 hypothetical protein [Gordonia tangerina]
MNTDPAIAAAQRAGTDDEGDYMGAGMYSTVFDFAEEAAREALAPLRKLHRKRTAGGEHYCTECCHMPVTGSYELTYQPWPCATARLVYSTEELT